MSIYYRDELGVVCVKVDENGIDFCFDGGDIAFSDGEKDYRIPVSSVISVIP